MKKSTVKRLEEIKSVCQLIEKLKSNLCDYHYFSNSSNISRLGDYGLTDKLRDKFKEVQVKYSSMVLSITLGLYSFLIIFLLSPHVQIIYQS